MMLEVAKIYNEGLWETFFVFTNLAEILARAIETMSKT